MVLHLGNLLPGQLFDFFQQGQFLIIAQCNGDALPPRSAGAANAMDVGFRNLGQVVVHHAGQILNVQSPRGDVRCDEHPDFSFLKAGQRLLTGGLTLVAVNGGGGNFSFFQIPADLIRPVLRAGKH